MAVRFVFDSSDECTIVHSALYACLRAVFGLSVAGVLVAVFSCMLVYQLLSHERKKMYWEQLELRCRSLYTGSQPPLPQVTGASSIIGAQRGVPCRCCEQCHSHRNVIPSAYPWDGDSRFWGSVPGQSSNFYSPNPVNDDSINRNNQVATSNQRPGWSWPRLPWQRNVTQRFRQTPSSPDSQYGFSNGNNISESTNMHAQSVQNGYSVIGGPTHYGIWGPPPPYSDPNSPARRGRYQYVHPLQCQQLIDHTQPSNLPILECHQHNSLGDNHSIEPFTSQQQQPQQQSHNRSMIKRANLNALKPKDQYENIPSDSDGLRDRFSNTLPIRKAKKRTEIGVKSIGPNQRASRVNVQNVFSASPAVQLTQQQLSPANDNDTYYYEGINEQIHQCHSSLTKQKRPKLGIENSAFLQAEKIVDEKRIEPSESEVYFGDVSSCCNMSDKNDNFYDETNQDLGHCNNSNSISNNKDVNDDYLVQRFGKREASIRCHLPLSQNLPEDYEKPQMNIPIISSSSSRQSSIHKDISRQSMCSVDSGEKTDFTDLSPVTPSSAFGNAAYTINENVTESLSFPHGFPDTHFIHSSSGNNSKYSRPDFNDGINANLISPTPFSLYNSSACTSSDFLQVDTTHRRTFVKPIINNESVGSNNQEMYLLPDVKYVIKESASSNSSNTTPLTLNYDHHLGTNFTGKHGNNVINQQQPQQMSSHHYLQKIKPTKNINITPIKRQNLGTNINTIIENLSANDDSGTLCPDNRREDHHDSQQDCNNSTISKSISDTEWPDHSDRRL